MKKIIFISSVLFFFLLYYIWGAERLIFATSRYNCQKEFWEHCRPSVGICNPPLCPGFGIIDLLGGEVDKFDDTSFLKESNFWLKEVPIWPNKVKELRERAASYQF